MGGCKPEGGVDAEKVAEVIRNLEAQARSPQERYVAISALVKIGEDVVKHPGEEKYAVLHKRNAIYIKALGHLPACDEAMKAMGFVEYGDDAWHFAGEPGDLQKLNHALQTLREAQKEAP